MYRIRLTIIIIKLFRDIEKTSDFVRLSNAYIRNRFNDNEFIDSRMICYNGLLNKT